MVLQLLLGPDLFYCLSKTVLPLEGLVHFYKERCLKGHKYSYRPFDRGLYLQSAFGIFISCRIGLVNSYSEVD